MHDETTAGTQTAADPKHDESAQAPDHGIGKAKNVAVGQKLHELAEMRHDPEAIRRAFEIDEQRDQFRQTSGQIDIEVVGCDDLRCGDEGAQWDGQLHAVVDARHDLGVDLGIEGQYVHF